MKTATLLLIASLAALCSGQLTRPLSQGEALETGVSWRAVITDREEPGETLIVSGTVYAEDGRTPIADASVYVYHTDVQGYYGANRSSSSSNPRLRARMRTNAEGKYEFQTIRPGSYPGSQNPAHIHYVVSAPGYEEKIFEIVFEDDPFVTGPIRAEAERENSVYSIKRLEKDGQGVLRCTQDIRLRRRS
jgi:protocatechuate 3,4-dioxygenase beta subunit